MGTMSPQFEVASPFPRLRKLLQQLDEPHHVKCRSSTDWTWEQNGKVKLAGLLYWNQDFRAS